MAAQVVSIDRLAEELVARHGGRRLMVAVAGAPGSGKSTLAERLAAAVEARRPGIAAVLPMDGYHYDDAVLASLGRLPRKGAPDTFDVGGLAHMLSRLADNAEETVAVPVFDRAIETSRAGARLIAQSVGIVIAEGNYLLLDRPPWNRLDGLFDVTVMIRTPFDELRRRLEQRWRRFGLPEDEVRRKVDTNDLPNGLAVINESRAPDYFIDNG